jgi:hypothetical protein
VIYLQFIEPYGHSRTSPMPPPGTPVKSTIIGVAPAGVTKVSAQSAAGVQKATAGDMYKIAGSDITALSFESASGTSSVSIVAN